MTKKILFSFIGLMMLNLSAQMKIDTLSIENYQIRTLKISENLDEISSLEFYQDFYWGNNDSGGKTRNKRKSVRCITDKIKSMSV